MGVVTSWDDRISGPRFSSSPIIINGKVFKPYPVDLINRGVYGQVAFGVLEGC